MSIVVKIEGLDQLTKRLAESPQLVAGELETAVNKTVVTINSEALKEAPVNKSFGGGNLRQNIRGRMTGRFSGEIKSNAPYSAYVEYGTRPHLIRPVVKRALANKRTGQFFGKLVRHPGTKANPFMHRAVKGSAKKIEGFFNTALENVVKALA